jgi:hypothetical protein
VLTVYQSEDPQFAADPFASITDDVGQQHSEACCGKNRTNDTGLVGKKTTNKTS